MRQPAGTCRAFYCPSWQGNDEDDACSLAVHFARVTCGKVNSKLSIRELRDLLGESSETVRDKRRSFIQDPDPARLHEFRISVRASRSLISLLRESFDSHTLADLRREGSRLSSLTSRPRNLDVLSEHWPAITEELDSKTLSHLVPAVNLVNRLRIETYNETITALDDSAAESFERLMRNLVKSPAPKVSADELVRKALRRINRNVVDVASSLSDRSADEVLHDARKNLKKLRYSLEMTKSHFPHRQFDRVTSTVSDLQAVLGRHHDAVTFSNELWSIASQLAGQSLPTETLVTVGMVLDPIEHVRRQSRRKSISKLRAYADPEFQNRFKKLAGAID